MDTITDKIIDRLSFPLLANLKEDFYILLTDTDGNKVDANQLYRKNFASLMDKGSNLYKVLSKEKDVTFFNSRILAVSGKYSYKEQCQYHNGRKAYVFWHCYPVKINDKDAVFRLGVDITTHEITALQYSAASTFGKVGFWRLDVLSNEMTWSDEIFDLHDLGNTKKCQDMETLVGCYAVTDQIEFGDALRECIETGKSSVVACTLQNVSAPIFLETKMTAEHNADGKLIGVYGVCRDRTSEVLAEKKFEQAKYFTQQLRQAVDAHALVSATDIRGKITFANSKFCEVSGYSVEELLGKNHRILKSGIHDRQFYRSIWNTISEGHIWQGEICNISKSGSKYWVYSTIIPFMDKATGRPNQYFSIRTEITQQKKLQKALDDMFLETMSVSEAKSNFIANMSHEFRTPLNHIIGFSELIVSTDKIDLVQEYAKDIHGAGRDLLEKIDNILKLVNTPQNMPHKKSRVVLPDMLYQRFIPFMTALVESSGRKFELRTSETSDVVEIDYIEVVVALTKITENAVKYTTDGSIVGLEVCHHGGEVSLTVYDNGSGLPDEIKNSAFEPFTIGAPVMTKQNSGLGLGLPLAKKLCVQNNGSFEVKSQQNKGTRVSLIFPVKNVKSKSAVVNFPEKK